MVARKATQPLNLAKKNCGLLLKDIFKLEGLSLCLCESFALLFFFLYFSQNAVEASPQKGIHSI